MRTMLTLGRFVTIGSVLVLAASCTVNSGSQKGAPAYGQGAYTGSSGGRSGPGAARPTEGYQSRSPRSPAAALLHLPGFSTRQLVKYQLVDGLAVMEGDIMLGPAATLPLRYGFPRVGMNPNVKSAVATTNSSHIWPNGVIPYEIDGSNSPSTVQAIQWAAAELSKTELEIRPRSGEADYVVFSDTGNGCTSYVGRIGGAQTISTTGCSQGSLVHELLHAAGFYHEHSRSDRDNFVTIVWSEIADGYQDAFDKRTAISVDIGAYDYASIMHYSELAFSKSGRPTIITKVPGAQIGQRDGLSATDKVGVTQLYGNAGSPGPGPTQPPGPGPTQPPPQNGSISGQYISQQGNVSCTQNGAAAQCSYSAGTLFCTVNGDDIGCAWSGTNGQGRAAFRRQANGVLAGTWGDGFSVDSRGAWTLTPDGSAPQQPPQQPPGPFGFPWPTGGAGPIPLPFPVPTQLPWAPPQ